MSDHIESLRYLRRLCCVQQHYYYQQQLVCSTQVVEGLLNLLLAFLLAKRTYQNQHFHDLKIVVNNNEGSREVVVS